MPERNGDVSINEIKALIKEKRYKNFNQLLNDPKLKNHREKWTFTFRSVNGASVFFVGKSARLILRTHGFAPFSSFAPGISEEIEYLEFQDGRGIYQGVIDFPDLNENPAGEPDFISSDDPSPVAGNRLDASRTCNHCHSGGVEGRTFRKYALSVPTVDFYHGFMGSIVLMENGKRKEYVPEGTEEFAEYSKILNLLFHHEANGTLTNKEKAIIDRFKLLRFRSRELTQPILVNKTKFYSSVHGGDLPNTDFVDKLEDLNTLRILQVISNHKSYPQSKYLLFAWATGACQTAEDWAKFSIPEFDIATLSFATLVAESSRKYQYEKALAQLKGQGVIFSPAPPDLTNADSAYALDYLLRLIMPPDLSGGISLSHGDMPYFYHSQGGINRFKERLLEYQKKCEKSIMQTTCDEFAQAFKAAG